MVIARLAVYLIVNTLNLYCCNIQSYLSIEDNILHQKSHPAIPLIVQKKWRRLIVSYPDPLKYITIFAYFAKKEKMTD